MYNIYAMLDQCRRLLGTVPQTYCVWSTLASFFMCMYNLNVAHYNHSGDYK